MKKTAIILTFVLCLVLLCGCEGQNVKKGEIVTFGQDEKGENMFFELACEKENLGFRITDDTELVVADGEIFGSLGISEDEFDFDYLSCDMTVSVLAGDAAESADDMVDKCVSGWYYAEKITVEHLNEEYFAVDYKPVIYLYPEKETPVSVKLDYKGKLTCTYPKYSDGWLVTAHPDGTIVDGKGKEYNYLYWEGESGVEYDFSQSFCVKGEDTADFLEYALAKLGLTRREANEFIVFWLPQMEKNPYNLIAFQNEVYTENAPIEISPRPDTLIRVFMAVKASDEYVDTEEQILSSPERKGFTAVEWGGSIVG